MGTLALARGSGRAKAARGILFKGLAEEMIHGRAAGGARCFSAVEILLTTGAAHHLGADSNRKAGAQIAEPRFLLQ
jgi:hypothetical protein